MTTMFHTLQAVGPVLPTTGRLTPLGLSHVAITGGYWAGRRAVNHDAAGAPEGREQCGSGSPDRSDGALLDGRRLASRAAQPFGSRSALHSTVSLCGLLSPVATRQTP